MGFTRFGKVWPCLDGLYYVYIGFDGFLLGL